MTYTAKTDTTFTIAANGREADNTTAYTGSTAKLNATIQANTTTSITLVNCGQWTFP